MHEHYACSRSHACSHRSCGSNGVLCAQADCESAQAPEQMAQLDELRKGFLFKSPLPVDDQTEATSATSTSATDAAAEADSPPAPGAHPPEQWVLSLP